MDKFQKCDASTFAVAYEPKSPLDKSLRPIFRGKILMSSGRSRNDVNVEERPLMNSRLPTPLLCSENMSHRTRKRSRKNFMIVTDGLGMHF